MRIRSFSQYFWAGVLVCANPFFLQAQPLQLRDLMDQRVVIQVAPNGTECFRDLLYESNLKPTTDLYQITTNPTGTIIICFGNQNWSDVRAAHIKQYLEAGGSLLVCSDSVSGFEFVRHFNIRITGDKLAAKKEIDAYKELSDCPYIIPFFLRDIDADEQSPFSIFRSQVFLNGKVATNRPSIIQHGPPFFGQTIQELAGFSKESQLADGTRFDPTKHLFAVGGTYGRGRYLILSDHSVFMNSMLVQDDIQNADFAREVIQWLQKDGDRLREKCIFVEDGIIQGKFDSLVVRDPNKKMTPLDKIRFIVDTLPDREDSYANRILAKAQQEDAFNRNLINQVGFRQIVRGILFTFMGMVLVYGLFWMWNRRFRVDGTIFEATQVVGRIPRGGVLQQRHQALLESGSLYEAFRQRIRERFLYLNGAPDHDGRPPRIEVDHWAYDAKIIRKRILHFWDVAFSQKPMTVKAEDWDAKNAQLRELMRDAEDGVWRFERSSTTT